MEKSYYVSQIEAHSDMLYRVALTILRNDEDCKDALQEAALKAWEKRHTLRDKERFTTWLTRILINECRNIQRKRRRIVLMESLPESAVFQEDRTLMMVLETLPETYRIPLVLRYSEGMSDNEIASVLRLPGSTVRGRIHRAKKQLKKELE